MLRWSKQGTDGSLEKGLRLETRGGLTETLKEDFFEGKRGR